MSYKSAPVKCCYNCPLVELCNKPRFNIDCYTNAVEMEVRNNV